MDNQEVILSKASAIALCDSIDLNSEFFDDTNEEYLLLKDQNPGLLTAYEELFTIAFSDESTTYRPSTTF